MDVGTIFYICDGHACGDTCPSPDLCNHTRKAEHALHKAVDLDEFILIPSDKGKRIDLWEPDRGE